MTCCSFLLNLVFLHDNACKFESFVRNRKAANPVMAHMASLDFRVDRHHFRNHVGASCRRNNNPDDCIYLNNVNTSIMEQINSWFGRYRHSARYMNGPRLNFYLLLACHLNNQFRTYKRTMSLDDEDESSSADVLWRSRLFVYQNGCPFRRNKKFEN